MSLKNKEDEPLPSGVSIDDEDDEGPTTPLLTVSGPMADTKSVEAKNPNQEPKPKHLTPFEGKSTNNSSAETNRAKRAAAAKVRPSPTGLVRYLIFYMQ